MDEFNLEQIYKQLDKIQQTMINLKDIVDYVGQQPKYVLETVNWLQRLELKLTVQYKEVSDLLIEEAEAIAKSYE